MRGTACRSCFVSPELQTRELCCFCCGYCSYLVVNALFCRLSAARCRPAASSLRYCVTALLQHCITALLHYRIIAFVGSPQKAWIASLRFLCDSALSELVTGFVGAFHLRVLSAFDLRLTSNTKTSHPTLSLQPHLTRASGCLTRVMTTFPPQNQPPSDLSSTPHHDLPPPDLQHRAISDTMSTFTPTFPPADSIQGQRIPQRQSGDFRAQSSNGTVPGANGNSAVPVPAVPHSRIGNGHPANIHGMGFDGPRSPPNNKSERTWFLSVIRHDAALC